MHKIRFPRAIWLDEVERGLLDRLRENIPAQVTYKISGEAKIQPPEVLAARTFRDSHHLRLTGTIVQFPREIYELPFDMAVDFLGGFDYIAFHGKPSSKGRDVLSRERNRLYRELLKATDAEVKNYFLKR